MSKVRYKLKNGKIAVYESVSYYDPEKKQARPKRTYLGLEDPETGEFTPTSGKRGRKKGTKNSPRNRAAETQQSSMGKQSSECTEHNNIEIDERYIKLQQEIQRLRHENDSLQAEVKQYRSLLRSIHDRIGISLEKWSDIR